MRADLAAEARIMKKRRRRGSGPEQGDETHKTRDDNMQDKEQYSPAHETKARALSNARIVMVLLSAWGLVSAKSNRCVKLDGGK